MLFALALSLAPALAACDSDVESASEATTTVSTAVVAPPVVSATPPIGQSPLEVDFACTSNAPDIIEFQWLFDDGTTSYVQNPTHTFQGVGVYQATCIITDKKLEKAHASVNVVVTDDRTPMAVLDATPNSGTAPLTVAFHTTVANGEGPFDYEYRWDDGTTTVGGTQSEGHTFSAVGEYTVIVVVTDGDGDQFAAERTVSVTAPNGSPSAVASVLSDPCTVPGALVEVDASLVNEMDLNALEWDWFFVRLPAGSQSAFNHNRASNPTFVPDRGGEYQVRAFVSDGAVRVATNTLTITVTGACGTDGDCCGGVCDPMTSVCALCLVDGNSCQSDADCCDSDCVNGICGGQACAAGETFCGDMCVDTIHDPSHCGGCDIVCGPEETCFDGACQPFTCHDGICDPGEEMFCPEDCDATMCHIQPGDMCDTDPNGCCEGWCIDHPMWIQVCCLPNGWGTMDASLCCEGDPDGDGTCGDSAGHCGDGICDETDPASCPEDCDLMMTCGNGICDGIEDPNNCTQDCDPAACHLQPGDTCDATQTGCCEGWCIDHDMTQVCCLPDDWSTPDPALCCQGDPDNDGICGVASCLPADAICNDDAQCCGNFCDPTPDGFRRCIGGPACSPDGAGCMGDADCCSAVCNQGVCGFEGSACGDGLCDPGEEGWCTDCPGACMLGIGDACDPMMAGECCEGLCQDNQILPGFNCCAPDGSHHPAQFCCNGDPNGDGVCGNGVCGDGVCDAGENDHCPMDCQACVGSLFDYCDPWNPDYCCTGGCSTNDLIGQPFCCYPEGTVASGGQCCGGDADLDGICDADTGTCGNGNCDPTEDPMLCPEDCGADPCGPGAMDCGMGCIDVLNDPNNCGTCNTACIAGETCDNGMCIPSSGCAPHESDCGGVCADTMIDDANCGMCGNTCLPGETCQQGVCTGPCGTELTDCGGICAHLDSDLQNCGACGNVCSNGQNCEMGVCMCSPDQEFCDGFCTYVDHDDNNCGGCGNACPAQTHCQSGACVADPALCGNGVCDVGEDGFTCYADCPGACPAGYSDCGSSCVDLAFDPNNCGSCNTSCGVADNCANGVCEGASLCGDGVCEPPAEDALTCPTDC